MTLSYNYFTWVLALFFGVGIGILSAINPLIAFLPIGLLVLFLLLKYPTIRLYYITLGSFFVFGGENFTIYKGAFLAGIVVVVIGSILNVKKHGSFKSINKLLISCVLFGIYVIVSILISILLRNVSIVSALRDCSPYFLFALSPLFAIDFAIGVSFKRIKGTFYILFILGTLYFAYGWILKRGYVSLPEPSFGYISFLLPLSFFAYCSAKALRGNKKRMLWLFMSALVLVSMLATGTRTSIISLIAPVLITFMGFKGIFRRSLRLIVFGVGIGALGIAILFALINFTNINADALLGKLSLISSVTNETSLGNDGSFQDRAAQTQLTIDSFKNSPIIGIGIGSGYIFNGNPQLSVDSPFSLPAKFGVLGIIFLISTFLCMISFIRNIGKGVSKYALIGFLAITTSLLVLASPIEDKGFSLALVLLLTYALKEQMTNPLKEKSEDILKKSA